MAKKLFSEAILFGVLVLFSICSAFSAEFNWNMADEYPVSSLIGESDNVFVKAVNTKSKERIKLTLHPGGALGYKQKDHFDAVTDGSINIASTFSSMLKGIDPVLVLCGNPYLAKDYNEYRILDKVARPYYEKVFEKHNQILLYTAPWQVGGIWSKRNITKKEDLKGLKIRALDPKDVMMFKELGAVPVMLSWGDVVPQLSTGAIDAVLSGSEGGMMGKLWEFVDRFVSIDKLDPVSFIHMNGADYKKLPSELKEAIRSAAAEAEEYAWKAAPLRIDTNYGIIRKHGVKIVEKAPKELYDAFKEVALKSLDSWYAETGNTGKKIVEEFRSKVAAK